MIYQKDFSNKNKVEISIERIQLFVPLEGYYLAFSGGKDSVVLKRLAEIAQVRFDVHYSFTAIDPPELVKFIKQYHPEVVFDRPKEPFLKTLQTKGFPIRQGRWCCEVLKENHGGGRKLLTGIRWAESSNRGKRKMVETCYKDKTKTYVNPIIDWTESDVWEFIHREKLPYCELYDQGFKRVGCLFCPMLYYKKRLEECQRYPKFVKAFISAFEKLYQLRLNQGNNSVSRWKSGEEMFWWWINSSPQKQDNDLQLHLFS